MSIEEIQKIYSQYGIDEAQEDEVDEFFPTLQYEFENSSISEPIIFSNTSCG